MSSNNNYYLKIFKKLSISILMTISIILLTIDNYHNGFNCNPLKNLDQESSLLLQSQSLPSESESISSSSSSIQRSESDQNSFEHHEQQHQDDLQRTSSTSTMMMNNDENDEWKNVLKKMTEKNPCGSNDNYTMCAQCGQLTDNEDAFYLCCLNLDGVREYCYKFVNYDLEQQKKSK